MRPSWRASSMISAERRPALRRGTLTRRGRSSGWSSSGGAQARSQGRRPPVTAGTASGSTSSTPVCADHLAERLTTALAVRLDAHRRNWLGASAECRRRRCERARRRGRRDASSSSSSRAERARRADSLSSGPDQAEVLVDRACSARPGRARRRAAGSVARVDLVDLRRECGAEARSRQRKSVALADGPPGVRQASGGLEEVGRGRLA